MISLCTSFKGKSAIHLLSTYLFELLTASQSLSQSQRLIKILPLFCTISKTATPALFFSSTFSYKECSINDRRACASVTLQTAKHRFCSVPAALGGEAHGGAGAAVQQGGGGLQSPGRPPGRQPHIQHSPHTRVSTLTTRRDNRIKIKNKIEPFNSNRFSIDLLQI